MLVKNDISDEFSHYVCNGFCVTSEGDADDGKNQNWWFGDCHIICNFVFVISNDGRHEYGQKAMYVMLLPSQQWFRRLFVHTEQFCIYDQSKNPKM